MGLGPLQPRHALRHPATLVGVHGDLTFVGVRQVKEGFGHGECLFHQGGVNPMATDVKEPVICGRRVDCVGNALNVLARNRA